MSEIEGKLCKVPHCPECGARQLTLVFHEGVAHGACEQCYGTWTAKLIWEGMQNPKPRAAPREVTN